MLTLGRISRAEERLGSCCLRFREAEGKLWTDRGFRDEFFWFEGWMLLRCYKMCFEISCRN